MHRLDRPAALDEAAGQPVEQLRMGGRLSQAPEIARRAHEALPEMVLPEAVDQDARRERMLGGGQPARELQPAAAGGDGRRTARKDLGKAPGADLAQARVVAADPEAGVREAGIGRPGDPPFPGAEGRRRQRLLQLPELLLELLPLRGVRGRRLELFLELDGRRGPPFAGLDLFRRDEGHPKHGRVDADLRGLGEDVGAREDAGQAVVVARGEGIELVVVAAREAPAPVEAAAEPGFPREGSLAPLLL
jgi:hypothetical protein